MSATQDTSLTLTMSGFFEEVRRRKVYRVAVAYVIAAGFIIQFASAVFPAWELPVWSLRLAIAFLLIGFPIALIFAWAYDVTPQGIQATPKTPAGVHRRRNFVFLIAAGIYATVGENDEVFRLIEHLLQVPNGLTVPVLKLDPSWDPVRQDPRFQALLDKYSAKR